MSIEEDKILVGKGKWALVAADLPATDEGPVIRHSPCSNKEERAVNINPSSYTTLLTKKKPRCIGCSTSIPKWLVNLYAIANAESLTDTEYFEQAPIIEDEDELV